MRQYQRTATREREDDVLFRHKCPPKVEYVVASKMIDRDENLHCFDLVTRIICRSRTSSSVYRLAIATAARLVSRGIAG